MARVATLSCSISHTTRPPRPNEVEGKDYYFVNTTTFQKMIEQGAFLEHASVFDHFYGTGTQPVEQTLSQGRDLLLEIDWQGAQQVRRHLPEAIDIFILPPSTEALETRLRNRATDTDEVIARRLLDSVTELSHWQEFKYALVNDQFERALSDLTQLVTQDPRPFATDRTELAALMDRLLAEPKA